MTDRPDDPTTAAEQADVAPVSLPFTYYRPPVLMLAVAAITIGWVPAGVLAWVCAAIGASVQLAWLGVPVAAVAIWWLFPSGRMTSDNLEVPRILNYGMSRTLGRFPTHGPRRLVPRAAVASFDLGCRINSIGVDVSFRDDWPLDDATVESGPLWLYLDSRSFGLARADNVVRACIAMSKAWDLRGPDLGAVDLRVKPDRRLIEQGTGWTVAGHEGRGLDMRRDALVVRTRSNVAVLPWSSMAALTDARVVEMGEPDQWMLRVDLRDRRALIIESDFWGPLGQRVQNLQWLVTLAAEAGVTCRVTGVLNEVSFTSRGAANRMAATLESMAAPRTDGAA